MVNYCKQDCFEYTLIFLYSYLLGVHVGKFCKYCSVFCILMIKNSCLHTFLYKLQFLISQGLVSVLISKLNEFVQKHGTVHIARPLSDDTVDSPGHASTSSSGLSPVCYSPISTASEAHSPNTSPSIFSPETSLPLYFSQKLVVSPRQVNNELQISVEVKR